MTNDPFTPIRQKLLDVLDVRPDAIVLVLAKRIVVVSAKILLDISEDRIKQVMAELRSVAAVAIRYGRSDISAELHCIARELEAELPENPVRPACTVDNLLIDFRGGEISGNCDGCNAAEVADALVRIAEALRDMNYTPNYIGCSKGKVCYVSYAKEEFCDYNNN